MAQQLVKQGRGGKIVNVSSTSGHVGRPDAVTFSAVKGRIVNLSRAMAGQLVPYKIRVNYLTRNRSGLPVVEDKGARTREFQNLAGWLGTTEDQARAIFCLVSEDSDFVLAANLIVDSSVGAAANFPKG